MLNLPVFLGKKSPPDFVAIRWNGPQRVGRDVLISWARNIPGSSQKTEDFRREIIWDFFLPFFARPHAIALGSKPPLVTLIARTSPGTRLVLTDVLAMPPSFHYTSLNICVEAAKPIFLNVPDSSWMRSHGVCNKSTKTMIENQTNHELSKKKIKYFDS